MLLKEKILRLNVLYLWGLALLDLVRGFLHTFSLNWANATFAQMGQNQDALMMLGAFGISNILTGLVYLLILKKDKSLAPYVLASIFIAYVLGAVGMRFQGIQGESSFYGKYMMFAYLAGCALLSLTYFWLSLKEKRLTNQS
jgi:hypothetical protein